MARTIANWVDGVYDPAHPDQDIITSFGYDALGRPSWVRDALGHVTASGYNSIGQLAWSTRNLVLPGWSGGALPASPPAFTPARPDQNISTFYGYDSLGRTTWITQTGFLAGTFNPTTRSFSASSLRVEHRTYDAYGRVATSTRNPSSTSGADRDLETQYAYDGAGNLAWQRDPFDREDYTFFDARNLPWRIVDNIVDNLPFTGTIDTDTVTELRYDALGRLTSQIDNYADGAFSASEPITDRLSLTHYDTLGRVVTTTLNYDPSSTQNPATNRQSVQAYDVASGRLTGRRDALGVWSSITYDALGQVVGGTLNCLGAGSTPAPSGCTAYQSSQPDQNVPRPLWGYDALGRLNTTTNATGVVTRQSYDGLGRVTSSVHNWAQSGATTPITNVTTIMAYDALGQVRWVNPPEGPSTFYDYDGLGHTSVITDAAGRVTRTGYDADGTPRWQQHPDGTFTVIQVDALGRTVATIQNYQDGQVASDEPNDRDLIWLQSYDAAGRVISTTDPEGRVTQYQYDLMDRLTQVTENAASGTCPNAPCNVTTRYRYDRAGNLLAIIDPLGHTRRFSYNAADERVGTSGGADAGMGWQYDRAGRLVGTQDPRGSGFNQQRSYDALGRLSEVRLGGQLESSYSYDVQSRRTEMLDRSGPTSYRYDPLGRVTRVSTLQHGAVGYGYNARGDRTSLTYPDGTLIGYTYTDDRQVETVQQGSTELAHYGYNSAGRLASITRANGVSSSLSYDGSGRVQQIKAERGSDWLVQWTWAYNRAGQRTSVTEAGTGLTSQLEGYSYDGLGRLTELWEYEQGAIQLPTVPVERYGYDLAGNRTDVWTYGNLTEHHDYDAQNRVVGWSYDAAGNLSGDGQLGYSYDGLGRLTEVTAGGESRGFVYDGDGVLKTRIESGGTTRYTQDTLSGLDQMLGSTDGYGTQQVVSGVGRLFMQSPSGSRTWYLSDALGSVRRTLNDQGSVTWQYRYTPWGELRYGSGPLPSFGFTGELHDQETGLVYLRARWYQTRHGTFTGFRWAEQESRNDVPYSNHPYVYGLNSPLNYRDPSGRYCTTFTKDDIIKNCLYDGSVYLGTTSAGQFSSGFLQRGFDAVSALVALLNPETYLVAVNGAYVLYEDPKGSASFLKEAFDRGNAAASRGSDILSRNPAQAVQLLSPSEWGGVAFDVASTVYGTKALVTSSRFAAAAKPQGLARLVGGQSEQLCFEAVETLKQQHRFMFWFSKVSNPMEDLLGKKISHVALRNANGTWTDTSLLIRNMQTYVQKLSPGPLKTRLSGVVEKYRAYDTFNQDIYRQLLQDFDDALQATDPTLNSPKTRPSIHMTPDDIPDTQVLPPGGLEELLKNLGIDDIDP